MKYNRIIFLDDDNTCRSLMAEAIFNNIMGEQTECEVMSRGLVVLFEEPLNQKVEVILHNHGVDIEKNTSAAFEPEEVTEKTLILTMTFQEKLSLIEEYRLDRNVFTLKEYIGNDDELLDPYGEELDIYEACYQDMRTAIEEVKDRFIEENNEENEISEIIYENETEDL